MTKMVSTVFWLVAVTIAFTSAAAAVENKEGAGYAVWDRDVAYQSSEHPALTLYADYVKLDETPRPILLYLQGWQGPGRSCCGISVRTRSCRSGSS